MRERPIAARPASSYLIVGGAGFIGSHFVDRLLRDPTVRRVTIFDNYSSGRDWHLARHSEDHRCEVVKADVKDLQALCAAAEGHHTVVHLASNPDIARAASEPAVDFDEGTLLTHHVLEAARRAEVHQVLYASGSGVYGDLGLLEASEDRGSLHPVSTYGASKLAGEALLCAYCNMFGLRGLAFRFGNVVGPRQTHGVGFDFLRRLRDDPAELRILGDGTQSKSYIHVTDVVEAVLLAEATSSAEPYDVYNVATGDYVSVSEIADLVCDMLGLSGVRYQFTGGDRGWKGDVPIVRLATAKIRRLGWSNSWSSAAALRLAVEAMLTEDL